jgi:hypothetical protein
MRKPLIILGDGAKHVGLAVMLSDLIRQNLEQKPEKIKDFNALDAKVLIEARDVQIVVGLEFKQGKLIISKNSTIKPNLHIISDSTTVLDLCLIKIKFGQPYFFDANGFKILKKILARQLLIRGLLSYFFLLVRLTKIVSLNTN